MSEKKIYKLGVQSLDDPFEFVLSTDSVDRYGDIVEQDFNLTAFRKNPIALYQHDSDLPIGLWEKLRREGNRTIGRLVLAADGTSELIDTLRKLLEQRILRAVSIGFLPGSAEPLDEDNPWGGYRLSKNDLLEGSLVSVPANPEALSLAKSLDPKQRQWLFAEPGEPHPWSAARQLGFTPRDSGEKRSSTKEKTMPENIPLAERIERLQKSITEDTESMRSILDENQDDITEEVQAAINELDLRVKSNAKQLASLQNAEKTIAMRTLGYQGDDGDSDGNTGGDGDGKDVKHKMGVRPAPAMGSGWSNGKVKRIQTKINRPVGYNALTAIATMFKSKLSGISAPDLIKTEFRNAPDREALDLLVRQSPALMTTTGWAEELVRETWGEFIALIRDEAIYPRAPGIRMEFGPEGRIQMPVEGARGTQAGGFRAEGAPIRVADGAYTLVDMTPKESAVISVHSNKLARHSIPRISELMRNKILADTIEGMDGDFLGTNARGATMAAGLQDPTSTGAANINNATAGGTVASITADMTAAISRFMDARNGIRGVIVIHPVAALYLRNLQEATNGTFPFRAEIAMGTFMGFPLISNSRNQPKGALFLIGEDALAHSNDYAPEIVVDDRSPIVFGDPAEHIVDSGTATTQDVRSMFQTDSSAIRLMMGLDWLQVRAGAVQVIDDLETAWGI